MDLYLRSRPLALVVTALVLTAGLLASAQIAAAASRSSAERAVRAKVIRLYSAYTTSKTIQVNCKRITARRYGCYYLVPLPTKQRSKIMLGNVSVRYRANKPRMKFSRPRCLGSGCRAKG